MKDEGIPIVKEQTKNASGRTIAVYRFGDPADIKQGRIGGRRVFSKAFKQLLASGDAPRCAICLTPYELRYLQIDHRVPYEVGGEGDAPKREAVDFMLLCVSCQRAKSWSCEHCNNWLKGRLTEICQRCYWARPESYEHIALKEIRRVDIVWLGEDEVREHTRLRELAQGARLALPAYAKSALSEHIRRMDARGPS